MGIRIFHIFESLNLMWPQAHQYSLKRGFICTILKFDIQNFHSTLTIKDEPSFRRAWSKLVRRVEPCTTRARAEFSKKLV